MRAQRAEAWEGGEHGRRRAALGGARGPDRRGSRGSHASEARGPDRGRRRGSHSSEARGPEWRRRRGSHASEEVRTRDGPRAGLTPRLLRVRVSDGVRVERAGYPVWALSATAASNVFTWNGVSPGCLPSRRAIRPAMWGAAKLFPVAVMRPP